MTDTTSAAAVQIPAAGTYELDPAASTVSFATRHLLGLAPVKGTFRLISGQITITDPLTSSAASAVIDAASFATGNPRRDQDVKSARLLHVNDHPQITFRSTELVQDGAAWRLRGQITARGTSAPAELTITEARRQRRRPADPRHHPGRPVCARPDYGQGTGRTPPGHRDHRPRNPHLSSGQPRDARIGRSRRR